jgi:hypothetical protein
LSSSPLLLLSLACSLHTFLLNMNHLLMSPFFFTLGNPVCLWFVFVEKKPKKFVVRASLFMCVHLDTTLLFCFYIFSLKRSSSF